MAVLVPEGLVQRAASPLGLTLIGVALLVPLLAFLLSRPAFSSKCPPLSTRNWPIVGDWRFWNARWEMYLAERANSQSGNFSFHIGKHPVVGMQGDESRRVFFDTKALDLGAGYAVLFNASPEKTPDYDDPNFADKGSDDAYIKSRITLMLRREKFSALVPNLLTDVRSLLQDLGSSGSTDPFKSIYLIVFQLTMRVVGCREIAENRSLLNFALHCFEKIEETSTPLSMIAPWAPLPSKFKRLYYGSRLYMLFDGFVKDRRKTGRREDDPLQTLIDLEDSTPNILTFVLSALFAGQFNSGINAAAVLCYLGADEHWRNEAIKEVRQVAAANCSPETKDASLLDQLGTLPLDVWETGFPLLDLCLRDSIRLNLLGAAFRRNMSSAAVPVPASSSSEKHRVEEIPPGVFASYNTADVHYNPAIYPEPRRWDPSRYMPHRAEDKKGPHAFIGWGSGRHPCLGMRFAKLEQNIIVAYWIAMFDWTLTDSKGAARAAPENDLNAHGATKWRNVRLAYTRKEE